MSARSDAVLERILAGDLDESSREAQEVFAAEPEARERLAELRAIESALADERSELRAARDASRTAGEDEIVRRFAATAESLVARDAERAAEPPAGGRAAPRRFRASWMLAIAAAILALAWIGWRLSAPARPGPATLGGEVVLSPDGAASDYRTFAWNVDPPANGFFELSIVSDDGRVLVHEPEITGRTFALDEARARSLPNRIRWRLVEHGADGAPTGRAFEASARR